ncbi:MAG: phosphoenolpyruvate--protein phosphotransferase [Frankiaceae bacterium]|nr:phosphoenolpyruvate--protein phosphotransferase [Frankiaceae bacterium]MBV9872843.1 phosphoenolpyruvate--protein phosphotransferase [Frankiaceae bacterium]
MPSTYTGIGVSSGAAAGPVARVHGPVLPQRDGAPVDVETESNRAADALDAVGGELEALAQRAGASGSVLVRQARISRDPSLASIVGQLVSSGRPAPRAAWEGFGAYRDMRAADPMRAVPDRVELDDIRDRVVAKLLGEPAPGIPDPGTPFVLVARDLSPAVTAGLDPQRVLAIVTERGGPTSHTAVLAKALGIPAVVACPGAASLRSGQQVLVDGAAGSVTAEPDAEALGAVSRPGASAAGGPKGPGRTADGRPVTLTAAVGSMSDVADAIEAGAEGVGVFRTEFAFLDRSEPPSVAEQAAAYREVFDAFPGRQVTVRTLDIGADKPASFVRLGDQPNPALGVRGLRVARRHPDLLGDQLTAIASASRGTKAEVRVMAPMVATSAEAAWFAAQAHQAGVNTTGVMVEVPAAALRAADLLRVVDFVSVGSNDLAQYTFATDRADGELSDLLDPWQPAFLDLVATVLRAGAVAGRPVMVCGEAPSDPLLALVLVGLGAAGLSMTPRALADVRMTLARHTIDDCINVAAAAVYADGPSEARARVREALDHP